MFVKYCLLFSMLTRIVVSRDITEEEKVEILEEFNQFANRKFSIKAIHETKKVCENRFSVHGGTGKIFKAGRQIESKDIELLENAIYLNLAINKELFINDFLPRYVLISKNLRNLRLKNLFIKESAKDFSQFLFLESLECYGCTMDCITSLLPVNSYVKKIKMSNCRFLNEDNFNHLCIPHIKEIEIVNCNMKKIPKNLLMQPYLKVVRLDDNSISAIDPYIPTDAIYLEELYLSSNNFKEVPIGLLPFVNLTVLDLSDNKISDASYNFQNNFNLKKLYLNRNLISQFPLNTAYHKTLEVLEMQFNNLLEIPYDIFCSKSFKKVDFNANLITKINSETSETNFFSFFKSSAYHSNLEEFLCSYNRLDSLPDFFGNLQKLETLNLAGNSFKNIPKCVNNLKSLKNLDFSFNLLTKNSFENTLKDLNNLINLNITGGKNFKYFKEPANNIELIPKHIVDSNENIKILVTKDSLNANSTETEYGLDEIKRKFMHKVILQ